MPRFVKCVRIAGGGIAACVPHNIRFNLPSQPPQISAAFHRDAAFLEGDNELVQVMIGHLAAVRACTPTHLLHLAQPRR